MSWLERLRGNYEIPSPSDIVPQGNIKISNFYNAVDIRIDYIVLNIPFTKSPRILPIMEIPDTNSMDGVMDKGNNPLYIEPVDDENHQILVNWLAEEFTLGKNTKWKEGGANDCVYRIMENPLDHPRDFSKSHKQYGYAIHRIWKVGYDAKGRWWRFKGINNPSADPYLVRDFNILYLNTGVIN